MLLELMISSQLFCKLNKLSLRFKENHSFEYSWEKWIISVKHDMQSTKTAIYIWILRQEFRVCRNSKRTFSILNNNKSIIHRRSSLLELWLFAGQKISKPDHTWFGEKVFSSMLGLIGGSDLIINESLAYNKEILDIKMCRY